MATPILTPHTCSTCGFKERQPDTSLLCRWGPPTTMTILAPGPDGKPTIAGHTTAFPVVGDTQWCWRHPDLIQPAKRTLLQS